MALQMLQPNMDKLHQSTGLICNSTIKNQRLLMGVGIAHSKSVIFVPCLFDGKLQKFWAWNTKIIQCKMPKNYEMYYILICPLHNLNFKFLTFYHLSILILWMERHESLLVNGTGNPRVSPPVPVPVPVKPAGIAMGPGFQWVGVMGFQQPGGNIL